MSIEQNRPQTAWTKLDDRRTSECVASHSVRIRAREFLNPVVRDALVVGRNSPISGERLHQALDLLVNVPFERFTIDDDVMSDIIVRAGVLKRVQKDRLIRLAVMYVKPAMDPIEVMELDIEALLQFDTDA